MSGVLDTYNVLRQKEIRLASLLSWHLKEVLKSLNRKISCKEKYRNPFSIEVVRDIHESIFQEYFRAIKDYSTEFGRTIIESKTKKGKRKSVKLLSRI